MTEPRQKIDLTVRRLIRRARSGMLATTLAGENLQDGYPYASLVTVGWGIDASPIFLFSALSDHTRNLARDSRAALLIEEASRRANPQTGPRVTLIGRIAPCAGGEDETSARLRFLARHPEAARYAGFGDFRFFRMTVESAHYVGGFARAVWVEGPRFALRPEAVAAVAACEESVLAHMNEDHKSTVDLYARRLLGRTGGARAPDPEVAGEPLARKTARWTLVGLDPDGVDLGRGAHFARLDFPEPIASAGEARDALIVLAGQARAPQRRKKK